MDVYDHLLSSLKDGPGLDTPAPRGVLVIRGPDAAEFLHRICSQDIEGMGSGVTAGACFLDPKGKLVATAEIGRDGDSLWIETATSSFESLAEYLDRFHFTERLEIERFEGWATAEWVGETAWQHAGMDGPGLSVEGRPEEGQLVRMAGERFGVRWVRVHGPAAVVEAFVGERDENAAGGHRSTKLTASHAACLRMAMLALEVGRDTDDRTIALEAPVSDHISDTKGCYTGQEIVARIHTYGHVNRNLVLLQVASSESPARDVALHELEDGDAVGRVTTSHPLPDGESVLAFGFVPRDFATAGTELRLGGADGTAAVVVGFGPT